MTPQLNNKRVIDYTKIEKKYMPKTIFLYKDGCERQALNVVSKYKNKFLFGL